MRTGGVLQAALVLVLATTIIQVSAGDLYWEGEEDSSNEFLEFKADDSSSKRFKRQWGFWPFGSNDDSKEEDTTESPDDIEKDDDSDHLGSGTSDRSDSEPREKTLRVTFQVLEPYRPGYSDRDSRDFLNISHSLASGVDALFDTLAGTQKSSLVRIQSLANDVFSCKVAMDIVTTGYDNTDRIQDILKDHIKNHGRLGDTLVRLDEFSSQVIDPALVGPDIDNPDPYNNEINNNDRNGQPAAPNGPSDLDPQYPDINEQNPPEYNPEYDPNNQNLDQFPTSYSPDQSIDQNTDDQNPFDWTSRGDLGNENYQPESSDTFETTPTYRPSVGPAESDNDVTSRTFVTPTPQPHVCPSGYLRCDDTRCLEQSSRCNGLTECYDGTDEAGCPDQSCSDDDFRCSNGKCIARNRVCNGVTDCPNMEDERDCVCTDGEFRCVSDGSCIQDRKRCDDVKHCSDGSDEEGCACSPNQWQCDHGTCIKRSKRCDGRVDCPTDRSDERNCIANGYFRCRNGKLIPENLRCNRQYDCTPGDFSDEQNCPCGANDFKCDNGHCIPATKHCDRTHDCQDGSDERDCIYGTVCMAYEYECTSGMCVQADARCNGTVECDDGTDETSCPCKRDQYPCRDGSCINIAFLCNGRDDCSHGEDEFNCNSACPPDWYSCPAGSQVLCAEKCNGDPECDGGEDEDNCPGACDYKCGDGSCLSPNKICDQKQDCADGSDENDCDLCDGPDDFRCESSDECINVSFKCNDFNDCPDGSDEKDCKFTLTTDNSTCTENEFQCASGQCINIAFHCDKQQDCNDGSDESNCRCPSNSFQCRNGDCISSLGYCDINIDCADGSDEADCPFLPLTTHRPDFSPRDPITTTVRSQPNNGYPSGGYPPSGDYDSRYPYNNGQLYPDNGDQNENGQPDNDPRRYPDGNRYPDDRRQPGGSRNPDDRRPSGSNGYPDDRRPNSYPDDRGQTDDRDQQGYGGYPDDRRQPSGSGYPDDRGQPGGSGYPDDRGQPGGSGYPDDRGQPGGSGYPDDRGQPGGSGYPDGSRQPGGSGYPDDRGQPGGSGYPDDRGQPGGSGYPDGRGQPGGSGYPDDRGQPGGSGYPDGSRQPGGSGNPDDRNQQGYGGYPDDRRQPGGNRYNDVTTQSGGLGYPDDRNQQDPYAYTTESSAYPAYPEDRNQQGSSGREQPGGRGYPDSSDRGGSGSGGCSRPNQWRCENGPCIDSFRRCDGHIDCPFDISDEFDCPANSPIALNVKNYPDEQTVRHGGDVVFQCRDEGPIRAAVRWTRPGSRIKAGSTDVKGRLEMFSVTEADSGTYICQATNYIGQPGAEARVTLHVESAPITFRPPFPACQPYEATCANGQCIPKSALCNDQVDCDDGSDEENCHNHGMCEPNQFKCANSKCVLKTWVCDSEDDCGDGSDEQNCGVREPGKCSPVEFACRSGDQCIPRSFHCDTQSDCMDGSDEIGCLPVHVVSPPKPSNLRLNPGDTLTLHCKAVGVPVPVISWRLNWGHVPPQCTSTSDDGEGILTCPNILPVHSGAYSCEAINNKGTNFAVPDSIVFVNKTDPCPPGLFNNEARSESECIRCFCFGRASECHSADLFTYNMPTPLGKGGTRLVGIKQSPSGDVQLDNQLISSQYHYQPQRNGATVTKYGNDFSSWPSSHPYLTLPESYTGNQLKSYGGHIKYTLSPQTEVYGIDDSVPTIIIKGKYRNLFHTSRATGTRDFNIEARLTPEDWMKGTPSGLVPASREDIMMALDDIEMILLRADMSNAGVGITDFAMESADHINVGLGAASLVEQCACPKEYEGLSCQKCAAGYVRKKVGPWLGVCEAEECPPGTYGNPTSGLPCKTCPCPLTNRENQFARTCSLGPDGSVICDCFQGYEGQHCERCAPGYEGNPLIPGNSCQRRIEPNCNPTGTKSIRPPDECVCKDNVQGRYCDQCKNDSFYLSSDFRHGCALCFCSGVTQQCMSSNYRRKAINVQFNVPQIVDQVKVYSVNPSGFSLGASRYAAPVETELRPQLYRGDVSLNEIDRSRTTVYYWSMPASFAGDKVTAYGGFLRYTLKNVPTSSEASYRSAAADVQLISENSVSFKYFGDFGVSHDGTLNATVQLLEKGWQRPDGKEVLREHFLMGLADVKTILIKATYSPNSPLALPVSASIDIAEPDGYGPTAVHVEQCVCPPGYKGTSCEDCAPGYTRSASGLYLQTCEPCECNGKSTMCHPDNNTCIDCADNTAGDFCEFCKPGYERDAYENCVPSAPSTNRVCTCDARGTSQPCDESGNCYCKPNVEGPLCDRCRPGTFGLDSNSPDGCLSCYCSGVTNDCHEGNHYTRWPLPAPVLDVDFGGFTLTDLNAQRVIKDDFLPLFQQSELIYAFSFTPDEDLYWSLPVFPGNRVLSYGGSLSLRQKFSSDVNAVSERGVDVVLDGGDISIYWTNPNQFQSGVSYSYQVPLKEEGWMILNTATPATRHNFMQVMRNLKRVLVRATVVRNIYETSIADVSMDTATPNSEPGLPAAKGIEICMCPPGYSGTSCESCNPGYYKDQSGACRKCNCNGHNCQLDNRNQVVCNCQPPYVGPDCTATGLVMELHPKLREVSGDSYLREVTFTCKYIAPEPLTITFYHLGDMQQPRKYYNESREMGDGSWRGEHSWQTTWDTREQGDGYECHVVTARGRTLGILTTSLPETGLDTTPAPTTVRPPPESTIVVRITSPTLVIKAEGSSVNFTCQAHSRATRGPLPVYWTKSDGQLPLERTQIDEMRGLIVINNLQVSDSGKYICETNDGINSEQATVTLKVPGNELTMPRVEIQPRFREAYEGDRVELECQATGNPAPTIRWLRGSNRPLPLSVQIVERFFIIENARMDDADEYRCIGTNTVGSDDRTAMLTIRPRPQWPRESLMVSNKSPSVDEGQSIRITCTGSTNVPAGSIDWIRQDNSLFASNVRSENGVLYIDYATPEDTGVYICQSKASDVPAIPVYVTVVTQAPNPADSNYNITVSVDRLRIPTGGSDTIECNPVSGRPLPVIRWSKQGANQQFSSGSSQRGNSLIIHNAQDDDSGYYMCEGTVNGDVVTNIYVYVDIERREAPVVEIWPQGEQAVPLNGEHMMTCRVLGGIPEPDVTWSRSGGRPLSPSTQIQPQNVLRFTRIEVNDEGEYTCTARNDAGTVSASAVIKVRSPPEITITPTNVIQVSNGDQINVECRASGYPEPTVSISLPEQYRVVVPDTPGVAALRIPSASVRDNGYYTCKASSVAGNTTDQFVISVDRGDGGYDTNFGEEGSGDIPDPNEYNPDQGNEDLPTNLFAFEGAPQTILECVKPGYRVDWVRGDSQPLQYNARQDSTKLIIAPVSKSDSGQYVCRVLDEYGEVLEQTYFSLEVVVPPRITLLPPTQTVRPGQSPTVQCIVDGDDIIDVTWRPHNRQPSSRVDTRSSTLIFHQIEIEDAGQYECFARSRYGNASAIAGVVVSEDTDRATVSHANEQRAHVGAAVHLSCNVTRSDVRISWTKDSAPLPRSVRQKSDGSLYIRLAQKSDSGRYVCNIQDRYGRLVTSNYVNLQIQGFECLDSEFRCYDYSGCVEEHLLCDGRKDCQDNSDEENCIWRDKRYSDTLRNYHLSLDGVREPDQSQQMVQIEQPHKSFRAGDNVKVLCRSRTRDIVRVDWLKVGTNQYVASIRYGDGAVLNIQGVTYSDAGVYRCLGTDAQGRTSYDDFQLEVQQGPSQTNYPGDRDRLSQYTAALRQQVDLTCPHDLEGPVSYEWRREFSPLPPEVRSNQPNLHLEPVTEADAGLYVCRVSNNRGSAEARAILTVTGVVPRFGGESFISLPPLKDAYKQFDIEISFKPTDKDGLIFYNSENQGREGDYIALQLRDQVPEFIMDSGVAQPLIVRGDRPLQLNTWHTIRLSRTESKVTMDVDNMGPFITEFPEEWQVLELKQPLYIGGVPDTDQLPAELAGASGFMGCVSMLILAKEEKNIMMDSYEQVGISECDTCVPNRCLNEGVCQEARNERGQICICPPGFSGQNCDRTGGACRQGICGPGKCYDSDGPRGYKCACPVTHTGANCEVKQSIEYPAFTGSAYLAIKPPRPSRTLRMSMKINAASPVTDGIIMYCAESPRGYGGFTSLAVHDGKLEFRYDLGGSTQPVVLVSDRPLAANDWTNVQVARIGYVVSLSINSKHSFEKRLDSHKQYLNFDTPIFVGGVDDESITLNKNTGVTGGFNGCIKDFMLHGEAVDIVNSTIQSANVRECIAERGDTPDESCHCLNGGTCTSDFTCMCPLGYTGEICENRTPSPFSHYPPANVNPCDLKPCHNGGTCRRDLGTRLNFTCDCNLGWAGDLCHLSLPLDQSVGFNGNGYLELPASLLDYDNLSEDPAIIAIAMHTTHDGVLLYQKETQSPPFYGDYLLLRIERGYVILDYDLGGDKSSLTVQSVFVNDGERHQIVAKVQSDRRVALWVDNQPSRGTSYGVATRINADSNIYLGGIPDNINQQGYPGFTGCIEQVELMDLRRGLSLGQVAVTGRNTQRCKEASRHY